MTQPLLHHEVLTLSLVYLVGILPFHKDWRSNRRTSP